MKLCGETYIRILFSALVGFLASGLIAGTNPVFAGTFSTSFPATFCTRPLAATSPVLIPSTGPPTSAWSFAQTATYTGESRIWCDVQFPRSVITATFTVNLTWSSISTTTSENVCWQAAWEITRPGQVWVLNSADDIAISTPPVSSSVISAQEGDVRTSVVVVASDMTNTICPTGSSTNTCAGSHGILQIRRSSSALCANDSPTNADLERIEVLGTTQ